MQAQIHGLLFALLVVQAAGCAASPEAPLAPRPGEAAHTVYLVNHGWHAGIVIRRDALPPGVWPQHLEFADAEFLEVGWGDRDYYMGSGARVGAAIKALLLPTDSVLHVVGFRGPVEAYFRRAEMVRMALSTAALGRLGRYLEASYALDEAGRARPLGPSIYGNGRFYLSRETYHLFNTCNAWTARALRAAGCPLAPAANLDVGSLLANSRAHCGAVDATAPGAAG